jgi:hypothetical protein
MTLLIRAIRLIRGRVKPESNTTTDSTNDTNVNCKRAEKEWPTEGSVRSFAEDVVQEILTSS